MPRTNNSVEGLSQHNTKFSFRDESQYLKSDASLYEEKRESVMPNKETQQQAKVYNAINQRL